MTRTAARGLAVQLIFMLSREGSPSSLEEFLEPEYFSTLASEGDYFSEYPDDKQLGYIRELVNGVAARREELDAYISEHSRSWKVGRISKTAAAVLRCALYESLYMDDVPISAAINEAVELSKTYDDAETVSFINGVLGGFARSLSGDAVRVEDAREDTPEEELPNTPETAPEDNDEQ